MGSCRVLFVFKKPLITNITHCICRIINCMTKPLSMGKPVSQIILGLCQKNSDFLISNENVNFCPCTNRLTSQFRQMFRNFAEGFFLVLFFFLPVDASKTLACLGVTWKAWCCYYEFFGPYLSESLTQQVWSGTVSFHI